MTDAGTPRSPFSGMTDLSARRPVHVLSTDEIEQMLASHQLYLKTEYHEGNRADFSSADLSGCDFARLSLRGIKIDRALV
jgi:uncharacterized protein YjbI with pentapeptide repeats